MPIEPVVLQLAQGCVRLEPLGHQHGADLLVAAQDPGLWTWWPGPPMMTGERVAVFIDRALAAQSRGEELPFAVIERATGLAIGSTRYLEIHAEDRGLEIGATWYGTAYQRTGVNTQCKYLLLRHAFETLGMVRAQLKTDARNQRSRQAIGRIGARYEGTLRKVRKIHDGFIRDTAYYSIIDEEWAWVKQRLEGMMRRQRSPG